MAGLFYVEAQKQLENAAHFLATVLKSTLALEERWILGQKAPFVPLASFTWFYLSIVHQTD